MTAVRDGDHTIDSNIFRTTSTSSSPATSTFNLDFVALNSNVTVDQLLPEPAVISIASVALLIASRRRRL